MSKPTKIREMTGKRQRSPKQVTADTKRQLLFRAVIDLRVRGYSFEEIADELGLSGKGIAYTYYAEAIKEVRAECNETTEEHITNMVKQFDKVIHGLQPLAFAHSEDVEEVDEETGEVKVVRKIQPANTKYTEQIIKAINAKAQLLGLNTKDNKPANMPLPWSDSDD